MLGSERPSGLKRGWSHTQSRGAGLERLVLVKPFYESRSLDVMNSSAEGVLCRNIKGGDWERFMMGLIELRWFFSFLGYLEKLSYKARMKIQAPLREGIIMKQIMKAKKDPTIEKQVNARTVT
jgi:hypothetical protein